MTTQKVKPRESDILFTPDIRTKAANLAYEAVDKIRDNCVLNSIYEIEIILYTDYGNISRSKKVWYNIGNNHG